MRTISIAAFGGPDVLQPVATDRPRPQPSEVLVKLDYAGINYTDIYQRGGLYVRSHTYQTPLPMVIGMEGAGTVAAVGDGVTDFRPGERVAYCIVRGSYAEYAAVPARRLVKLPDDIDVRTGAALMLQGLTAHYLAHSAFQLKAGTSCLVHAAAGGVGQLLTQIAKIAGATVIGTVGSHEKAEIAKARGVDHVVLYRETDFRDAVRELTGGIGVDVVYDAVGKDTIAGSIRSLKRRGLCVNYGGASGLVESIEPLELAEAGSVFFTRPHLADYLATPEELRARAADLFQWIREGRLTVPVDREFPLEQAADAHRYLEARKTRGKLLLKI
jgi:NADPH2:quinone reductase